VGAKPKLSGRPWVNSTTFCASCRSSAARAVDVSHRGSGGPRAICSRRSTSSAMLPLACTSSMTNEYQMLTLYNSLCDVLRWPQHVPPYFSDSSFTDAMTYRAGIEHYKGSELLLAYGSHKSFCLPLTQSILRRSTRMANSSA
jgi:hypothetical protein